MNTESIIKREQLAKKICAELNNFVDLKHTLISIINDLKELTGFEAVGVRLNEEHDYPYYLYDGFPDSFIKQENSICTKVNLDEIKNGVKPELDCMCGKVIRGNIDTKSKKYTAKGSFWTNNYDNTVIELDAEPDAHNYRKYCYKSGYKSVGLFPIKTREENVGLIQLNDKRPNMFTDELIEYVEMIGEQIGIAVENALLYEKVKDKNTELENTVNDLNQMQSQLVEAKKMTALADLVTGVAHEVYQPISQSLNIIESLISKTKSENPESEETRKLIEEQQSIYKMLSNAKALVKSFRTIAFDQFQESRHLININGFLNDVIRVIKPSFTKKQIEFVIECNQHSEIMGFTGVLSQVITILAQNSYHHGFKDELKGIITLGCGLADEDTFELTVADNGCGISENIEHKLFEPFFTTDKKNHVGLGLHTAKNLVENKLKGSIMLDSEHKDGTRWIIQFPA